MTTVQENRTFHASRFPAIHHTQKAIGTIQPNAIAQIVPEIPKVESNPAPARAEPMALVSEKRANSVAKMRPRTWPGSDYSSNCVEKTQMIDPPMPRIKVPKSRIPKLHKGALIASPMPPIRYPSAIARRMGRLSSPVK